MLLGSATSKADGAPVLIVGLSALNIALLAQGKPIAKDVSAKIGFPLKLIVMYGATEEAIAAEFQRVFPDVPVHVQNEDPHSTVTGTDPQAPG